MTPRGLSVRAASNYRALSPRLRCGSNGQQTISATWRDKKRLLRPVPGVSPTLTKARIAAFPELGRLGRKQIVALTGLAPLNCERAVSGAVASSGAVVGESVRRCT